MSFLSQISIKSRLLLILLGITLIAVLIIGYLALRTANDALQRSIENQMTSIGAIKSEQFEVYLDSLIVATEAFAGSSGIVESMESMREAYAEGAEQTLTSDQQEQITTYYEEVFLPELAKTMEDVPILGTYLPRTPAAQYFQYHYIVNSPLPPERSSDLFVAEEDETSYRELHALIHPGYREASEQFGFQDLYLIDIDSGNIVYSVSKEPDFGTSLYSGPYSDSGLGVLAAQIRNAPEEGVVRAIDYRDFPPSLNAPTAFLAAPIVDQNNQAIGIMAVQLPAEEINNVMTGDGAWVEYGLGETGESYLVGPDLRMRSVARAYLEDKDAYIEAAREDGASDADIQGMEQHSTILNREVDTEAVRRALEGETGTDIIDGYQGEEVLSYYTPFDLGQNAWAVISEIQVSEAFAPIYSLQRTVLIWGLGLMLGVAFLAIALAQYFVRPIDKLATAAREVSEGHDDVHVDINSNDEFGDLANSFNGMVDSIRLQKEAIEAKNTENEQLLLNILPAPIAQRLRAGERIADQLQQVSVIFIHMVGFSELAEKQTAVESATLLEEMIDMLDTAAEEHDVERVKTVGETYIGACGLTTARLDHAKQAIAFATSVLNISRRLDQEYEQKIGLQIGINSGPVVSGVVGTNSFSYELWGETVEIANRIHIEAPSNGLLITESVYERIDGQTQDIFELRSSPATINLEMSLYEYTGLGKVDDATSAAQGEEK